MKILPSVSLYRWHSINLIPNMAIGPMYSDDSDWRVRVGSHLELCVLGVVLSASLPIKLPSCEVPVWGPMYSKRRKTWRFFRRG